MKYQPDFLNQTEIFSDIEKELLTSLSLRLPTWSSGGNRNIEEVGMDFVYSSAQLEGNTYDQLDTIALLKMGQTAGGKLFSDALMLLNLRASYNYINHQIINSKQEIKTGKDWFLLIKDIHSLIAKDLLLASETGIVRNGSVNISGTAYTPLENPNLLQAEMSFLTEQVASISNHFDKAIYLHNNIAYLQYFRDCNKRTARSIMAYVFFQADIFPCIMPADSYRQYSKALVYYYETGDHTLFKEYFIWAFEQTVQRYEITPDPKIYRQEFNTGIIM